MLSLTRYINEEVVINPGRPDEVVVTLLSTRGDRAQLGFTAPKEVVIHRREIVRKIEKGGRP